MPPRIHALPALVVNQIAAGEVIERPASVVKELLENAVDAGARRIEVDVETGGHDLVRVVDDGCGILPEDLPLAFASHATSKLRDAGDLFSIGTFGFRGEALASIGGVAHVTLQSRPGDRPTGAAVECKGSELSEVRVWNGSPGTRVEVRQLFFNTPVRRKFLRTPATEMGHVCENVMRLALAHARLDDFTGLHLVLRNNGKLVHEVTAGEDLPARIERFFGPEVAANLYAVEGSAGPMALSGFVADPSCDRPNGKLQHLFVNGRWVRERTATHAVQEAYRGLLMTGRYAVAFLFVEVPTEMVDVNIHPTKTEVRFRDTKALHHMIYAGVKARLRQANLVPKLYVTPTAGPAATARPAELPFVMPAPSPPPLSPPPPAPSPAVLPMHPQRPAQEEPRREPTPPVPPITSIAPPPARPYQEVPRVLQLYDAYLVVETEQGMLVIDQHALHERILYEQFRDRIAAGELRTQRLLIPEPIDLPAEAAARALEQREELGRLGLGVEDFGGGTLLLTSYPALLGRRSPRQALLAAVDHLTSRDRVPSREALFEGLLSLMACHSAVRAGERLSPEMMQELLAQRHLAEDHHHCPHGRPTALLFTRQDLEKQFRRA